MMIRTCLAGLLTLALTIPAQAQQPVVEVCRAALRAPFMRNAG